MAEHAIFLYSFFIRCGRGKNEPVCTNAHCLPYIKINRQKFFVRLWQLEIDGKRKECLTIKLKCRGPNYFRYGSFWAYASAGELDADAETHQEEWEMNKASGLLTWMR